MSFVHSLLLRTHLLELNQAHNGRLQDTTSRQPTLKQKIKKHLSTSNTDHNTKYSTQQWPTTGEEKPEPHMTDRTHEQTTHGFVLMDQTLKEHLWNFRCRERSWLNEALKLTSQKRSPNRSRSTTRGASTVDGHLQASQGQTVFDEQIGHTRSETEPQQTGGLQHHLPEFNTHNYDGDGEENQSDRRKTAHNTQLKPTPETNLDCLNPAAMAAQRKRKRVIPGSGCGSVLFDEEK